MSVNPQQFRIAPLFNRTSLIRLLVPLIIEQFLMMTVGMADTIMVATAGEAAVSGVSLVDSINLLLIQIFAALSTGGTVVVSQYLGRQDRDNADHAAKQLLHSATLIALLLMALALGLRQQILDFIYVSLEPEVMGHALDYFLYTSLAYPFMAIYNAGAALYRAMGNSKVSMYVSLLINVVNIAVNALLIYGFDMAAAGAGIGTLVSRITAAVIMLILMRRPTNLVKVRGLLKFEWRPEMLRRILQVGVPNGLENGMFQIGKLCVSSLTSTLGTSAIAANAVANSVSTLANIPGNTMSLATIPVIGQCLGAGEKKQAQRYSVTLLGIAITGLAVTNAALFFLMPEVVTWFNLSAEASAMCTHVVHWFNLFSIFFWATSFTLPNALRAGGDAKFTMSVSIVSMWLFRVILSYIFVLQFHLGLTGVWFGMFIDWICRSLCFLVRFARGKWMEHKVI